MSVATDTGISIRGLSVTFGALRAVDDVTMDIAAGEFHGLIGPNGAGKSTLIDAISGRVRPSSGAAYVGGKPVTGKAPAWLRRRGLARSFQTTSVFPSLTVRKQLDLVGHRLGDSQLDELVEYLELEGLLDRVCGTISYGEQRRVDLALALIGRPRVLLMDEPGAGLTAEETMRTLELVAVMVRQRKLTVVLVEHDVSAVFRFAHRITVLDRGRVLTTGTPTQVRQDPRVIEAYLGSMA